MNFSNNIYRFEKIIKVILVLIPGFARERLIKLLFRDFWVRQQRKRVSSFKGYSLAPFDKYKCIFVHIPKCAGVSVCKTLFGCLAGGHMEMWKYQVIFGDKQLEEYFKFTVVRNPWDRLYSAFCFLKGGGFGDRDKRWFDENIGSEISFEEFVKNILTQKKNILHKNHFKCQVHFLKDLYGDINLNYIARFENLAEEVKLLSKKLDLNDDLIHSNVTKSKEHSYVDVYDSHMIEIVADVYAEDIDTFKYNFSNS